MTSVVQYEFSTASFTAASTPKRPPASRKCTFSLECCAAHSFALSIAFMMMSCE